MTQYSTKTLCYFLSNSHFYTLQCFTSSHRLFSRVKWAGLKNPSGVDFLLVDSWESTSMQSFIYQRLQRPFSAPEKKKKKAEGEAKKKRTILENAN